MLPPDGAISAYRVALRGHLIRFQADLMAAVNAELERRGARTDSTEAFLDHLRRLSQRWQLEDMSAVTHEAAEATASKNSREFKKVFGLKVRDLEPGITDRINRFRTENVGKIKSLKAEQVQELRGMLDLGLEQGKHANTLRSEIQERFKVTRSKADLLARDQVLKLNANITKDRQTRAGVKRYKWITARDERTRGNPSGLYPVKNGSGDHWHLHGKVFSWDDPPVVEQKTGRRAHPGEDYQCRCVAVPEIEELSAEDEALFESAVNAPAPAPEPPPPPPLPEVILPSRPAPVMQLGTTIPKTKRGAPKASNQFFDVFGELAQPTNLGSKGVHWGRTQQGKLIDLHSGARVIGREEGPSLLTFRDGTTVELTRENAGKGDWLTKAENVIAKQRVPDSKQRLLSGLIKDEEIKFLRDGYREGSLKAVARAYDVPGVNPTDVATGRVIAPGFKEPLPPIQLVIDQGEIHVRDGRHRLKMAQDRGATHIRVSIETFEEAHNREPYDKPPEFIIPVPRRRR